MKIMPHLFVTPAPFSRIVINTAVTVRLSLNFNTAGGISRRRKQGEHQNKRDFAPTLPQGSKKEEQNGSPSGNIKTRRIYFVPAWPSRIQKREKRHVSPICEPKKEGFILPLPCSKDSKDKTNGILRAEEPKTRRIYIALRFLQRSKRHGLSEKKTKTQPLFTIYLSPSKRQDKGAEIRRIFLWFSLPCERDRGDRTATDLRLQKQRGCEKHQSSPHCAPPLRFGSKEAQMGTKKCPPDLHFPQAEQGRAICSKSAG